MKISVILEALTGSFETDMARASKSAQKRMKELENSVKQTGALIGTALAAGATAAGLAIKAAIDNADALDEMSQRTGIAIEELSRLQIAAKLGAVDLETLQKSVGRLAVQQQNYVEGNKQTVALFDAIGVKAVDSSGKLRDANEVLRDLADVFARLPDGANKTALAIDLFGKAGQQLIPFLNKGSAEIARIDALADKLGVTISANTGRAASDFNDTVDLLGFGVKGLAAQVATDLLPDLQALAREFLNSAQQGDGVSESAHRVAEGIRFVGEAASAAVGAVQGLTSTAIGLYNVLSAMSKLNPGYALAKFLGGEKGGSLQGAGVAFDQAGDAFFPGAPKSSGGATKRAGSRARGGRGMGAASQDDALAAYIKAQQAALAAMEGNTGATHANAEAKRAAADAAREQEERERDLQEAVEKASAAQVEFNRQLEDLVAQQGGPLAESALRYRREEDELRKVWAEGSTPAAEDLAAALNALHAARDADAEAIRRQLDPGGERLKQMQDELDLLNLQTKAERDRAAFLLDNPSASEAQADAAARIQGQIDQTRESISAMDQFRDSFTDFAYAAAKGEASFEDFADTVVDQLLRMSAQWLTTQMFGEQGSSGSGWLSSLFGIFLSGGSAGGGAGTALSSMSFPVSGFAAGGSPPVGMPYIVGEHGPELRIDRNPGTIIPNHQLAGSGSFTQVNNFNLPRRYDNRSEMQIAQATERSGRTAARRNGR